MHGSDFISFNVENLYCGPNSVQDFRISVRGGEQRERVSSFRALKRIGVFRRPRKIGQNAAWRNMFNLQEWEGGHCSCLPTALLPSTNEGAGRKSSLAKPNQAKMRQLSSEHAVRAHLVEVLIEVEDLSLVVVEASLVVELPLG